MCFRGDSEQDCVRWPSQAGRRKDACKSLALTQSRARAPRREAPARNNTKKKKKKNVQRSSEAKGGRSHARHDVQQRRSVFLSCSFPNTPPLPLQSLFLQMSRRWRNVILSALFCTDFKHMALFIERCWKRRAVCCSPADVQAALVFLGPGRSRVRFLPSSQQLNQPRTFPNANC